jgi:hypothetical protein
VQWSVLCNLPCCSHWNMLSREDRSVCRKVCFRRVVAAEGHCESVLQVTACALCNSLLTNWIDYTGWLKWFMMSCTCNDSFNMPHLPSNSLLFLFQLFIDKYSDLLISIQLYWKVFSCLLISIQLYWKLFSCIEKIFSCLLISIHMHIIIHACKCWIFFIIV